MKRGCQGKALAAAKARHQVEKAERKAKKQLPEEERSPELGGRRRPRRAATAEVNYAPPQDFEVTNFDLLPNW